MGALARQFAERVRAEELRDERLNEAAIAAEVADVGFEVM